MSDQQADDSRLAASHERAHEMDNGNAPGKLRVLVVEDSALYRQNLLNVLRRIEGVDVIGTAANGEIALQRIAELQPDLITLDVEMPVMDGIETLRQIKTRGLSTVAIMVSSLTLRGAAVTMDALFEGAFDFVTKPCGGLHASSDVLRTMLEEKINALRFSRRVKRIQNWSRDFRGKSKTGSPDVVGESDNASPLAALRERRASGLGASSMAVPKSQKSNAHSIVVLGASTGGPRALRMILPRLATDLPTPVIVVQHMPAKFTGAMANRLNSSCPMQVSEIHQSMPLPPGGVYLAPGGQHLELAHDGKQYVAVLQDPSPTSFYSPSVDVTLESAASIAGANALAVIMTGMGSDGMRGGTALRNAGGSVFAQDEATSDVFGMPKSVIEAGVADRILSLGKIAPAISRHFSGV
ncbi:MAG: chemotaxis response regulator protein-glutamate methylesterase [Planctomycetota bacterium]